MLRYPLRPVLRLTSLLFVLLFSFQCAAPREGTEEKSPRRARRARPAPDPPHFVAPDLVPPPPEIQTIQLFRTGNETEQPVVRLGTPETITLSFDLLEDVGRSLSVYFYHANRRWERDLLPIEYLTSFHRDDLHDYQTSRATQIPYVHYEYRFPNNTIKFRMSGNYILRVTEQGNENEVLFEKPFFVTEQSAPVDFGVRNLMLGGESWASAQPVARFEPPGGNSTNIFDYRVCFARNSRFDLTRCAENPSVVTLPQLQFYLEPEQAFEPEEGFRVADVSAIRVGNQIVATNLTMRPYELILETDYANLLSNTRAIFLGGQPVVRGAVRDLADPDLSGEYVRVRFTYIPPGEKPLDTPVVLVGSFNGWQYEDRNRLSWNPDGRRYEGTLLLKQGVYEYRYTSPGYRPSGIGRTMPASEHMYMAFVYYSDHRVNTDRLLSVQTQVAP